MESGRSLSNPNFPLQPTAFHSLTMREGGRSEVVLPQLAGIKGHWATSVVGRVGRRPKAKNQDSHFYREYVRPCLRLLGVCDGHGEHGHLVSGYVSQHLPQLIRDLSCRSGLRNTWKKILQDAFAQCCNMLKQQRFDTECSGCTCVVVGIQNGRLHCGNVGDSRAVLGTRSEGGRVVAVDLSNDHKPDRQEEKQRVLKFRGRIGSDTTSKDDVLRVWVDDTGGPGLAMTRVLGDWSSTQAGVISVPEVISHTITEKDVFVVVASDGVWEVVSSEEAVQTVAAAREKGRSGSKALVDLAVRRAQERDNCVDDVTAVVVELNS